MTELIKKLNGHSGCTVNLVQDNECIYVSKMSGDVSYNFRLKKQCKKQSNFISKVVNISAPKIIRCGYNLNRFFFDMEFVQGKTMAEYSEYIKIMEIADFMKCLFHTLYWNEYKEDLNVNKIFSNKINELKYKTSKFQNVRYAIEILEKFDWSQVPKSPCHGDLTLENILVTKDKNLYLIDFLDSFYNSWMIDIAKLLQDLEFHWSFRNSNITSNQALRLQVAKEALLEEILKTQDGENKVNTIYHLLLLNIVRIYPYANEDKTILFLNDVLEKLILSLESKERVMA